MATLLGETQRLDANGRENCREARAVERAMQTQQLIAAQVAIAGRLIFLV